MGLNLEKPNDETPFWLKYIGFVTTAFFYTSPCTLIYDLIYTDTPVEMTSFFVIVIALIHSILWFTFGLVNYYELEIWSNFIGTVLCLIWLIIYLYFYSKKNLIKYSIFVFFAIDVVFEIGIIEYDFLTSDKYSNRYKENILRVFASIVNVLMFFTPGLNFGKLIKTKNFRYINIYVAIFGALNTSIFIIIGIVGKYKEKIVANIIGLILCLSQIIFYKLKYNKNQRSLKEEKLEIEANEALNQTEKESKKKKRKKSSDVDKEVYDYI